MLDDQKKIIEKYREEEQKNDEKEKENLRCRKKDEKTIRNIESRNATYLYPTYSLN